MCVPALSPCVPTAVFLRLSLDLLPVLSNPSTHCPGLFPLACVSQVGFFLTTGPRASAAARSPSPFSSTFVTRCSGLSRQ